ncbi:hypothetical protein AMATHDRAFT_188943 [Amanita thiersii Skay4041]|uniref:Ketoreductase domain-containing protein n=1 Tax=Amanita thiersii Skay4041 TaxID=703135 RepID=A0A2A9NP87_9AGAR|nr:hypothetical protein AMATHDRAFT_188943 [Amanita thiersii Skay4041]
MASPRRPVVIVTGASKGIGLAVTRILLQKFNAIVIGLSRSQPPDKFSADSFFFVECDITDETALTNAIERVKSTHQHIDGLVLSAGTLHPLCRIADTTPLSEWKTHFDLAFFSLVTAVKAALPALRNSDLGGKIIFLSSGAAIKGTAGWGPYNASKAAMNSLCRTLAEEEPLVVSVAVRPGMVDTDVSERVCETTQAFIRPQMQACLRATGESHMDKASYDLFIGAYNEGKLIRPEDCGHVVASLALNAPQSLSGEFLSWDSDVCKPFRKEEGVPQM